MAKLVSSVVSLILTSALFASAQDRAVITPAVIMSSGRCVLFSGSGSPEGVVTGKPCDTYWRSDAGATTPPVYIKWIGTGNTGWHAAPGLTRENIWTESQTIEKNLKVDGTAQFGATTGGYALDVNSPELAWVGTWTGANWSNRRAGASDHRSDWNVDENGATLNSYDAAGAVYRPLSIYAAPFRIVEGGFHVGGVTDPGDGNAWFDGYVQVPGYASQTTGWRIGADGSGDFRYLFTDELHAKAFMADMEQALAGGQIVSKSVAVLDADFTVPAAGNTATLTVKDLMGAAGLAAFASGDLIRVRTFSRAGSGPPTMTIADAWGTVGAATHNGDGTQSYTFTRSATIPGGLAAGTVIAAGGLALDYGVSGNGYYEVSAVDGANGSNSPYAQAVTWSSTPNGVAPTLNTRMRVGNLAGITGTAGEYGLFAGVGYGATNGQYILASNAGVQLHGVDLKMWEGTTNVLAILRNSGAPTFALGSPAPTAYSSSSAGVWMGADSGVYKFRVGSPAASWLSWDPTYGVLIRQGATIRAQFAPDGSGSLATNGITWDTAGNATVANAWNLTNTALYSATAGMVPADYPFYAGAALANRATAPFRVSAAGAVTATSGAIGGWTIGSTALTNAAGTVGMRVADYPFWAGHATPGSAPFRVTAAGALYASNATLAGSLTAGNVTVNNSQIGWSTGGNSLYTDSSNLVVTSGNTLSLMGTGNVVIGTNGSINFSAGGKGMYWENNALYGIGTGTRTLGTSSYRWHNLYIDPGATNYGDYPLVWSSGNHLMYYKNDGWSGDCNTGTGTTITVENGIVVGCF